MADSIRTGNHSMLLDMVHGAGGGVELRARETAGKMMSKSDVAVSLSLAPSPHRHPPPLPPPATLRAPAALHPFASPVPPSSLGAGLPLSQR